jgi:hypothetical protein
MMKRPVSVSIAAVIFILAGISGIVYHARDLNQIGDPNVIVVFVLRALAILGGVFAFRGANWARWLLTGWIVYHVYLSMFHDTIEFALHVIIAIGVAFAFFNTKANVYFRK